jgi:DNA-binding GntR family transcriptional regulator
MKSPPARTGARPQYRDIAGRLQADIIAGKWEIGGKLEPETILATHYEVSRFTIRQAMTILEEKGLISRKRRIGTVVTRTDMPDIMVQQLNSINELLQYPPETHLEPMRSETVEVDVALSRLLGCDVGSRWSQTQCIRIHPGHPHVCWSDIYVPEQYADIAKHIGKDSTSAFRLMERTYGLFATDISMDIFAGTLSPAKAKALGVEPGAATLVIVRRYRDHDGKLFEVSVSEHPASRFSYSLTLKRQENDDT